MVALTRLAAGTEVCLLLSHCWRDRNTYHLLVNLLVYLLVNLLVNVCRQLKVTDNGWNGIGFRTGEGVLRFTADRMIPPGSTWGYDGVSMDTVYGTWDKLSVSYIQRWWYGACHMLNTNTWSACVINVEVPSIMHRPWSNVNRRAIPF
jgi:hypothetical protein